MDNNLFTIEHLYQAYRDCRRNKRNTINALRFEIDLLDNIYDLREELVNRTYHPATSICFVQRRPKMREIFAADFRNRVVHHLLVDYLEQVFEPIFIHDSYACRREKGVHAAVTRLRYFLNRVTANGTKRAWYLKEDISGFFMSIDKEVLYDLVCRRIKREDIRWLSRVVIFHDCTQDYYFKGNPLLLKRVPAHKTLFCVGQGKGLPIGNLTSQFFANVYLNELDQYVKHTLGCRYYLRYCDDFLLLHESPEVLENQRNRIEEFVRDRLLLELNHHQHRLTPVSSGIDFLGYIVRRSHVLVRRRVVNHLHERLDEFECQMAEYSRGEISSWHYPEHVMKSLRSTVSSYLGHLRWGNCRGLVRSLFRRHPVLSFAFFIQNGRLIPRYIPGKNVLGLRKTYMWWVPPAVRPYDPTGDSVARPLWVRHGEDGNVLVFFPVGRFYEFYDSQALIAHEVLGLKLLTGLRGFRHGCGFHRCWLGRYIPKALRCGYHVALIDVQKKTDGSLHYKLSRLFRSRCGAEERGHEKVKRGFRFRIKHVRNEKHILRRRLCRRGKSRPFHGQL